VPSNAVTWRVQAARATDAAGRPPASASEAHDVVDGWLAQPAVTVVRPGRCHAAVLRELVMAVGTAGKPVTDARLAALAVEHGAELCSRDRDLARFPGRAWVDPLS
jgi:uncharacterized protein